jgi:hypothetical protein
MITIECPRCGAIFADSGQTHCPFRRKRIAHPMLALIVTAALLAIAAMCWRAIR